MGAASVLPGFLVGALTLQIRSDFDEGVRAIAAGVTVFFLAGAFGTAAGGRLAERVGGLRAMRASVIVTAGCLLAIALAARSLPVFFLLLAAAGAANAVTQPAINLYMARAVPLDRQGLAFGIKQSAIPVAVMVSGLALPFLALPLGWRPAFAICAGMAALVALAATLEHAAGASPAAPAPPGERPATRSLLPFTLGAALASSGPSALSAYLVASAVDTGIGEGTAGLLAAVGSATSLLVRVACGQRADRRRDYGFGMVVALLALGSLGFLLLSAGAPAPFVAGAVVAYALGWGWPGLFNLAVVHLHRAAPGAATGVTQSGIYVGASGGPAAYGLLAGAAGYTGAWAAVAGVSLMAALVIGLAART
ncbi:MAG TPA: MFS transporter [Thermoleophilaceae bacterium]